ncbi:hypothetical protein M422DRAFT_256391 [Sphaerobolus stellatus SS14]|uniref:Uncharacterized protein n=1 Tax=Sphaerobolus stellatus (strain SS14) TaxID=990650 RepID=A0A0C9VRS2_SPHS4|nr:hypothetical protein M422DRAFT_256391 [Sphaerobolus stellatus SS14]
MVLHSARFNAPNRVSQIQVFHANQATWKLLYVLATITMVFEWKTKIEEAQAQLHDLHLEKKKLEEHHYEATSLIAPIRRLPGKILGRVLLFVIPDIFKWDNPQHRIGKMGVLEDINIESLYLARLHLLRVCHCWKHAKLLDVYISGQCQDKDAKETVDLLMPYLPQVIRLALLWPPTADILSSLPTEQEHPLHSLKWLYIHRASQAIANLDPSTVEQLITPWPGDICEVTRYHRLDCLQGLFTDILDEQHLTISINISLISIDYH